MTIRQELAKHIKDGKLDTYGAILLIGVITATFNTILNMEMPNEIEENITNKQN